MTVLCINSKEIKTNYDSKMTIELLSNEILSHFAGDDEIIEYIFINDEKKDVQASPELLNTKLENYKKVDFILKKRSQFAFDALKECQVHINSITEKIDQSSPLLQNNNTLEFNKLFIEIIDSIDLFVKILAEVRNIFSLDKQDHKKIEEKIGTLFNDLVTALGQILDAKENDDMVLLNDTLKYELIPVLNKWKSLEANEA